MRWYRLPIALTAAVLFASCRPELSGSSRARFDEAAGSADCAVVLSVGANRRYTRMTDALKEARDMRLQAGTLERAADVICIDVAPGRYVGTFDPATLASRPSHEAFPLVIDAPGIALRGATQLILDAHDRPIRVGAAATILIADPPATDRAQAYALVTTTERSAGESRVRSSGNDARIEGFVLSFAACSAAGIACEIDTNCRDDSCALARQGTGIRIHNVDDYLVHGNAVVGAGFALDNSFASGRTIENLVISNSAVGISHRGPAPSRSLVHGNSSTDNGVGGMVLVCAAGNVSISTPVLPHEHGVSIVPGPIDGSLERTDIAISDNDFSRHAGNPGLSFGLRIMMFGIEPYPTRRARCSVTVTSNRMHDTSFGIVTDAGFPFRTRAGTAVDADWNAELDGRYENNDVRGSTEDVLLSLTRFTSTRDCGELDATRPESFEFLRDSTYVIDGGLVSVCYDNRALDPSSGERLGNELRIEGTERTGLTCAQVTACD